MLKRPCMPINEKADFLAHLSKSNISQDLKIVSIGYYFSKYYDHP
jgi:hypothetical protein